MMNRKITVIDYGMGNIYSVVSAIRHLECEAIVSSDPDVIRTSSRLLLPGVGSFRKAMESLTALRLDGAIIEAVKDRGTLILGICLGMQLLGQQSSEDGSTKGLDLISSQVTSFSEKEVGPRKIPHIGFDQVSSTADSKLFENIPSGSDFYFVHSYKMQTSNLKGKAAICNYGVDFLAAYEQDNIFATQFHPEKSQSNGLLLLQNFMSL
jgi:glutamine amidotransferase